MFYILLQINDVSKKFSYYLKKRNKSIRKNPKETFKESLTDDEIHQMFRCLDLSLMTNEQLLRHLKSFYQILSACREKTLTENDWSFVESTRDGIKMYLEDIGIEHASL